MTGELTKAIRRVSLLTYPAVPSSGRDDHRTPNVERVVSLLRSLTTGAGEFGSGNSGHLCLGWLKGNRSGLATRARVLQIRL